MRLNPDWSFWLWTDEDNRQLIAEHYPAFLRVYDGYDHYMKRVDAARIFYLHRFGGVYMDMDFACLKPFERLPMPPGQALFSYQRRDTRQETVRTLGGQIANNVMGGPPRHPFFAWAVYALPFQMNRTLLTATGPNFLSSIITTYDHEILKPTNLSKQWVVHRLPTVYPTGWKSHGPNPCGTGTAEDLERCRAHGVANASILATFWTQTWKKHFLNGTAFGAEPEEESRDAESNHTERTHAQLP